MKSDLIVSTPVSIQMGLMKCADVLIGIPGMRKGISGGEKKRLVLATAVSSDCIRFVQIISLSFNLFRPIHLT